MQSPLIRATAQEFEAELEAEVREDVPEFYKENQGKAAEDNGDAEVPAAPDPPTR